MSAHDPRKHIVLKETTLTPAEAESSYTHQDEHAVLAA